MIKQTTDMAAVARILNHPKVYGMITDDGSPKPCVPSPHMVHLINDEETGLISGAYFNAVTYEVHIAVLPALWGRARSFVKEGLDWCFKNTNASKIIGFTPAYNRAAVSLAKRCGFKEEGRIKNSFLKNWELHDQIVFGLSKYD